MRGARDDITGGTILETGASRLDRKAGWSRAAGAAEALSSRPIGPEAAADSLPGMILPLVRPRRGPALPAPVRSLLPLLLLALGACAGPGVDHSRPLPEGAPALLSSDRWPVLASQWEQRKEIAAAIDHSLTFMAAPSSQKRFPKERITHERAKASLVRFRDLLLGSSDAQAFETAVQSEFEVFISAGWDGLGGGVLFTGYCTPELPGSLAPDSTWRFPLYALPADLVKGEDGVILGRRTSRGIVPYPTRAEIETASLLTGTELVWLKDPLDAYLAHVNGSAVIRLPDGSKKLFAYAGKNGREYRSLREHLISQGKVDPNAPGLPGLRQWAASASEAEVLANLRRNESYVFFRPDDGPVRGSLGVPVSGKRSLATDKTLFPPGSLVVVEATLPLGPGGRVQPVSHLMLDQDTGGAIRTAGRADVYLGTGRLAERSAGSTISTGQLFYLFLKEDWQPVPLL